MSEQNTQPVDMAEVTTDIEQIYERAVELLKEETTQAEHYLTEETICRKIWENNSTIVPYFELQYTEYAMEYQFREKCGKIAENMANEFLKIEKKLPVRLPVQTIEIPFPSPWTERIFDCVQKKRKQPEDIWDHMGDALWEETRERVQAQALKKMHQESDICRQSLEKIKKTELQMIQSAFNEQGEKLS